MKKIAIWYHCKISGEYIPDKETAINIVDSQFEALRESGLADAAEEIHVCLNGGEEDASEIRRLMPAKAVLHVHPPGSISELPTIALLRKWLPGHEDWAVFYHHSKGVTAPHDPRKILERMSMEKFNVRNWKVCVSDLEKGYDAVGVNLVDPDCRPILPGRFFGGNFWWATGEYLSQLTPVPENCDSFKNLALRCLAERWIGDNSPRKPRMFDYERPNSNWWRPPVPLKHKYHIQTPFSRFNHINFYLRNLAPFAKVGVTWHPIFDADKKGSDLIPKLPEWVRPLWSPPNPPDWYPGHSKSNFFIRHGEFEDDARVFILNDDDWIEDNFFQELDAIDGDFIVTGMKRGQNMPSTSPHAASTLEAMPENLKHGLVSGQQMILTGKLLRQFRFGSQFHGDWVIISEVLTEHQPVFAPKAYSLFNFLEPGRWNNAPKLS